MNTKLSFAFLAGMLADFAFLWIAGGGATLAPFAIGCFFGMVFALVLALSFRTRILRAGALLNALGAAPEENPSRHAPRRRKAAGASRAGNLEAEFFVLPQVVSTMEKDLTSALRHLGAKKAIAENAVRQAIAATPQGDFNTLFRLAVASTNAVEGKSNQSPLAGRPSKASSCQLGHPTLTGS